jgi:hypothetical protein
MTVKLKTKINFRNHTKQVEKYINEVLERRLDGISERLKKELQTVLSKPGPSKPGQPPGITQLSHSERVPGGLMKSIGWVRDGKLKRRIGTPLERGFWMEMGVRGRKVIRPVRARALLVPIPRHVAEEIEARHKNRQHGGGRGGFLGLVEHANGQMFMLRAFVIQGPIAPRPWLKPTLFKNLRGIGLTLGHKIH